RKAAKLARAERAQKRGGGRVRHAPALAGWEEEAGAPFSELIGREPDPAFAAEGAGECRRLLGLLGGGPLRSLALWRLEGHTNGEIAQKLEVSVPTVERKLALIRACWQKGVPGSEAPAGGGAGEKVAPR